MRQALETVNDNNFEVVREYLHTGKAVALNDEQKRMLDLCLEAYGLLKKYPQRNVCIRQFMVTTKAVYNTAAKYVDFARKNWPSYIDVRREFLNTYLVNQLLTEISSPDATEAGRAKNLATLQKYIEHLPDQPVNPSIMESNTINVQININGHVVALSEKVLEQLPMEVRNTMMQAMNGDIEDAEAVELLDN